MEGILNSRQYEYSETGKEETEITKWRKFSHQSDTYFKRNLYNYRENNFSLFLSIPRSVSIRPQFQFDSIRSGVG